MGKLAMESTILAASGRFAGVVLMQLRYRSTTSGGHSSGTLMHTCRFHTTLSLQTKRGVSHGDRVRAIWSIKMIRDASTTTHIHHESDPNMCARREYRNCLKNNSLPGQALGWRKAHHAKCELRNRAAACDKAVLKPSTPSSPRTRCIRIRSQRTHFGMRSPRSLSARSPVMISHSTTP